VELHERLITALGTVRSNGRKPKYLLKKRLKKGEVERRSSYGLLAAK
jgi:hypothetical protein